MTREQKPYFEILNNFWNLLKPYVEKEEDVEAYKKIMSDEFRLIFKDRGEMYSEGWWNTTRDIIDYPDKYKKTKYVEFCAEFSMSIMDYWQFDERNRRNGITSTYYDFMTYAGRAFVNEWERIRR